MINLNIKDIIKTNFAVSTENGEKVYQEIKKNLESGNGVVLDFQNIDLIITAFLNAAIGSLFKDQQYTTEFLNKNVMLTNIDPSDTDLFFEVINRAKEYFSNREDFEKNNNDTIYGKD